MQFDPDNAVVMLCAQGMDMEGQGKPEEAAGLFARAWETASSDLEKFTAAHYVARHQKNVADKLKWDETALYFALKINNPAIGETLPSLYLNIARCHEDLSDFEQAKKNYRLADSFTHRLPDNGYGNMIKQGIKSGLERMRAD